MIEPALPKKKLGRNKWTEAEVDTLMSMAAEFTKQNKRVRWREIAAATGHHESSCALKYHTLRSRAAGRLARELVDADLAAKHTGKPQPPVIIASPSGTRRWTAEEIALLEKLHNDGLSWSAVADRLDRTEGSCATKLSDIRRARAKVTGDPPLKARIAWREEDVAEVIRLREVERMVWADIDRRLNRPAGSSCCKYESLRRGREQVSKHGGGGRIDFAELGREREARRSLAHPTLTAAFFGDPLPGYSALDKRLAGIADDSLPPAYHTRFEGAQASRPKITLATEPMR